MSDIAKLAGVSESTVSRSLNNSPLINIKTRERIQALAREHQYTINRQAQNLRRQSSKTVLVAIPVDHSPAHQISDPFTMELLGSIADALTAADFEVILSRVHRNDWRQRVASHSYLGGLIVLGQSVLHEDINQFAATSDLPMVVWGAQLPDQAYTSVGCDNRAGGYAACEHLIQQKRQRIIMFGDISLPEVRLRYEGYLEAHKAHNLNVDPALLVSSAFDRTSAEQAVESLHASRLDFDAIFAASDVLAQEAIRSLVEHGMAIPRDVSVVGFDNIMLSGYMAPAMTTVSQDIYQGGQRLVGCLLKLMQGEPVTSEQYLPKLIQRASA